VKTYTIEYAIKGSAWVKVEAESEEEARRLADAHENRDGTPIDDHDVPVEWEFTDVRHVYEGDA
jgi:hypothetical protein